jgi:hypothetical protein
MRCHDCDGEADFEVESDGVIVGLCETHLRDQVETMAANEIAVAAALRDVLDVEDW